MIDSKVVNGLLGRVRLYDIRVYLERHGWQRLGSQNSREIIYRLPVEETSLDVLIPSHERFDDIFDRMSQAVLTLSQIYSRTVEEICLEIVGTNSDSVSIRLNIPRDKSTIPIEDAPRHVKAIRNLLLFSASAEVVPKPYYDQAPTGAAEILSNFEFCHTFPGSFCFEVSSFIATPLQVDDMFEAPKPRLVVERLARSLVLLDEATRTNSPELLIDSYDRAINSRMCDAIIDIGIEGKVKFSVGIDWATSLIAADDVESFRNQSIGEPQFDILKYVSKQLKIVEAQQDVVIGQVVNLHCINNPTKDSSRRVVALKVAHIKHGTIEVKMNLGPDHYLLAIHAHTVGSNLKATGQLQRNGNMWLIEAITSLTVAPS